MNKGHSTPSSDLRKPETAKRRKAKPHPDFPLFMHASGQWAKKVRGKTIYFGTDPEKALQRWRREKDDLIAGVVPRSHDPNSLTVKGMCDLFLESKESKVETQEITKRTWDDYHAAALVLVKHLGRESSVEQLRPEDFRRLRAKLGKGVNLKTLDGRVTRTRAIFNHASKNGYLTLNLAKLWGTEFDKPNKASIAKQEGDEEQLFTPKEIRSLLGRASVQMKAMILLGINGGYGNTDCALIEECDVSNGWLSRKRRKTGKRRRTPLWPETQKAIDEAVRVRGTPKNPNDEGKLFITKYGNSWEPSSKANPVSQEFAKVCRAAGITGPGKSFYSLRHTFQTIGDETKDFVAVSSLMGHVDYTISGVYREKISDDRLLAVVNHVRDWLFAAQGGES